MTLIAHSMSKSNVMIIGDTLVSGLASLVGDPIEIPTLAQEPQSDAFRFKQYVPTALRQKVYVINPKLCLAVAGYNSQLIPFLIKMKERFSKSDFSYEDVVKFLNGYNFKNFTSALGIYVSDERDGKKGVQPINGGNWETYTDEFGIRFKVEGSGMPTFIDLLKAPRDPSAGGPNSPTDYDLLLTRNFAIAVEFLARELTDEGTLINDWGAGFEVITCYDGTFEKFGDLTYIFCDYILYGDGQDEFILNRALNYKYKADVLYITTYVDADKSLKKYQVPPLDISDEELKNSFPDIEARFSEDVVCYCFICYMPDGTIHYYPAYLRHDWGEHMAIDVYVDDEGNGNFYLADSLKEQLRKYFRDWPLYRKYYGLP